MRDFVCWKLFFSFWIFNVSGREELKKLWDSQFEIGPEESLIAAMTQNADLYPKLEGQCLKDHDHTSGESGFEITLEDSETCKEGEKCWNVKQKIADG